MTPYKTLQSRSLRRCPLRSDAMTDILQPVRSHWKVDFPVDVLIHIHQTLEEAFSRGTVAFRQRGYCSRLIAPVMIHGDIGVLHDHVYKLVPYLALVLVRIRPKGMLFRDVALTHQHTNQIVEPPVRY